MISSLTKHSSKINPLLLQNLQKLYLARARVFHNRNVQLQNIDEIFDGINNYSDGRGITIMKKFDSLFDLKAHSQYPEK